MPSALVDVRHKLPPLKALTAVRFFAAMYVVLYHDGLQERLRGVPVAARFMESGHTSVPMFFVLSGFVLAYNYPSVRSKRSFWIARFARIYPVYLLATLSMLGAEFAEFGWRHPVSFYVGVVLVLGLVQTWWPRYSFFLNVPAWTLSVEAFFYALFPFLIGPVSRMRRRGFVGLQAVCLAVACAPWIMHRVPALALHGRELARWLQATSLVFRVNNFVVGVYLGARWGRSVAARMAGGESSKGDDRRRKACLVLGGAGSLTLLCAGSSGPIWSLLVIYAYAFLLAGLADTEWWILNNRWMQVAGEISYGIYILQGPVLKAGYFIQGRWMPWVHPEEIQVALIVPVAYVVWRWVEVPLRLFLRRVMTGRVVAARVI